MSEPGGGETQSVKPAKLYEIRDVKVGLNDAVKKAAIGVVGTTTVSIAPDPNGIRDELEVAFLKSDDKGKDQFVGDPIRLDAGQGDLEEVADTFIRYLKDGASAEDIIKMLEESNDERLKQNVIKWKKISKN